MLNKLITRTMYDIYNKVLHNGQVAIITKIDSDEKIADLSVFTDNGIELRDSIGFSEINPIPINKDTLDNCTPSLKSIYYHFEYDKGEIIIKINEIGEYTVEKDSKITKGTIKSLHELQNLVREYDPNRYFI